MARFTVDAGQLAAADTVVADCVEDSRIVLGELRAAANALNWRGAAGGSFRLAWAQWDDNVGQLLTALVALADATGRSGQEYAATESAVADAASRTSA